MPQGANPFPFGKCRICNDKATGIHYGVATCEGCKGFYKRSTCKGDKYRCYFGGKCVITPENRIRCKSCRYRKCLQQGMAAEAVKMGRIPKLEKERALEEAATKTDSEELNTVSLPPATAVSMPQDSSQQTAAGPVYTAKHQASFPFDQSAGHPPPWDVAVFKDSSDKGSQFQKQTNTKFFTEFQLNQNEVKVEAIDLHENSCESTLHHRVMPMNQSSGAYDNKNNNNNTVMSNSDGLSFMDDSAMDSSCEEHSDVFAQPDESSAKMMCKTSSANKFSSQSNGNFENGDSKSKDLYRSDSGCFQSLGNNIYRGSNNNGSGSLVDGDEEPRRFSFHYDSTFSSRKNSASLAWYSKDVTAETETRSFISPSEEILDPFEMVVLGLQAVGSNIATKDSDKTGMRKGAARSHSVDCQNKEIALEEREGHQQMDIGEMHMGTRPFARVSGTSTVLSKVMPHITGASAALSKGSQAVKDKASLNGSRETSLGTGDGLTGDEMQCSAYSPELMKTMFSQVMQEKNGQQQEDKLLQKLTRSYSQERVSSSLHLEHSAPKNMRGVDGQDACVKPLPCPAQDQHASNHQTSMDFNYSTSSVLSIFSSVTLTDTAPVSTITSSAMTQNFFALNSHMNGSHDFAQGFHPRNDMKNSNGRIFLSSPSDSTTEGEPGKAPEALHQLWNQGLNAQFCSQTLQGSQAQHCQSSQIHSLPQPSIIHSMPQPSTIHSMPQPSTIHSLPQPSPNHSLPQPSPNHSLPQPSPNHSLPQPSPNHFLPQPSPNHSLPQPSPNHSLPQPSTIHSLPQPSTIHSMPQTSTIHSLPQPSTIHSLPQPSTIHSLPQPSPNHSLPQPSPNHSLPQPSTIHSLPQPSTIHSMPQPSTIHSLPQPSTIHSLPQPSPNHSLPQPSTIAQTSSVSQPFSRAQSLTLLQSRLDTNYSGTFDVDASGTHDSVHDLFIKGCFTSACSASADLGPSHFRDNHTSLALQSPPKQQQIVFSHSSSNSIMEDSSVLSISSDANCFNSLSLAPATLDGLSSDACEVDLSSLCKEQLHDIQETDTVSSVSSVASSLGASHTTLVTPAAEPKVTEIVTAEHYINSDIKEGIASSCFPIQQTKEWLVPACNSGSHGKKYSGSLGCYSDPAIKEAVDNLGTGLYNLFECSKKQAARDKYVKMKREDATAKVPPTVSHYTQIYPMLMEYLPILNEKIINFCLLAPGFTALDPSDQKNLLKRAYYDVWMLTSSEYFVDGESYLMVTDDIFYIRRDMEIIIGAENTQTLHCFAEQFNALGLSHFEVAILCCVQLTAPSYDQQTDLKDVKKIQKLNSFYLDLLIAVVTDIRPDSCCRVLIDIFRLVPLLSEINRLQRELIGNFSVASPPGNSDSPDTQAAEGGGMGNEMNSVPDPV